MNEINHFKVFILYSGDVTVDVDHLHIKIIHLVRFFYIIIKDRKVYPVVRPPPLRTHPLSGS
jgi:hypothetical protein